ncbi:hypothetical protein LTR53_002438 [Teratosphaeriaceae sp. CCFEE 6253]|nr:hypothetical protein LTR53_002438 [Teratosphaeriaceae sp. CCFEE 6253]
MADITPDFNLCLQSHNAHVVLKKHFDVQHINTFLQEAYSINARITDLTRELRAIRPAYLSTAAPPPRRRQLGTNTSSHDRSRPLTDTDRDALDAESKQLLRQLNGAITGLKQAEDVRNQTASSVALSRRARGGLSAIGRWAAGGAQTAKSVDEEQEEAERDGVRRCRESVITFLQLRLGEAGKVQGEMMEVRLGREVERSKSVLYKSRMRGGIPYAQDGDDGAASMRSKRTTLNMRHGYDPALSTSPTAADDRPAELTSEQQQVFAAENSQMLKHYEDQLDALRTAERSIMEISELQSTLVSNIEVQSEHIEQLVQDSYSTTENLGKGNQELKRASERRSTARLVFLSTVGFCGFLVVWDLVF